MLAILLPLAASPAGADRASPERPAIADSFAPHPRLTGSTLLCSGYADCRGRGMTDFGYQAASGRMYWQMYPGVNCTNYTAYRMIQAGLSSTRPAQLRPGRGNAEYWGPSFGYDQTPTVGAIAWWKAYAPGIGGAGHTAMVEQVISPTEIVVSESNWGRSFDWRRLSKGGNAWPTGFIHLRDTGITNTAPPAVSGAARVGVELTAHPGSWTPGGAALAYQWLDSGQPIQGATGPTYRPLRARLGRQLAVRVTASKAGYAAASAVSAPTAPVAPGTLLVTGEPAISGLAALGQTLTVSTGSFTPGAEAKRVQWEADGVPIAGATAETFAPTGAELGKSLTATVTAVRRGFDDRAVRTAPTAAVTGPQIQVTGAGGITGAPVVGETLAAAPVAVTPADVSTTYTWLRNGAPVGSAPTYRVTREDVGAALVLQVTLRKPGYSDKQVAHELPGRITTTPWFKVRTVGTRRGAVVRIWVAAPGVAPVPGRVTVRVGRHAEQVTLVDGKAVVRFSGLRPGPKLVRVAHPGGGVLRSAATRATVRVAR